jgi:regulator of RNase E activity RraA
MVTDGVVRDREGVKATGLPVWCAGAAAPPSVASLHFVGWGEVIGCGGVCVEPDDVIVADGDGAVVIPRAMAAEIRDIALEQEAFEDWALSEVHRGVPLPGLYPPNQETKERYAKAAEGR